MATPDAGSEPCRVTADAASATSSRRRDGFTFDDETIESCLVHPEGIVD